jgi:subtilisin family serine protease
MPSSNFRGARRRAGSLVRLVGALLPFLLAMGAGVEARQNAPVVSRWIEQPGAARVTVVGGREAVADEILVRFRTPTAQSVESAARALGIRSYRTLGRGETIRMRSSGRSVESMIAEMSVRPDVEYVEPNYVIRAEQISAYRVPGESSFALQWALRNTGQEVGGRRGTADADIDADLAWDLTTGAPSVVVGITDTGIYYDHIDLAANVWSAPAGFSVTIGGETVTCAAGTHGYDAISRTCDPVDQTGHGTHVAGTIGAVGNNGFGIAGVNWTTRLMGLRMLDESGFGSVAEAIDAIEFAIQVRARFPLGGANVRVLTASWGGPGFSLALRDQIAAAEAAGMIFVTGAGNSSSNNDATPDYPSGYGLPNIVSAAATGMRDELMSFSNYGATTVDLGAPGDRILSTLTGASPSYVLASGTSMAAAHLAGAAALVLSSCNLAPADLRDLLMDTGDAIAPLHGRTASGRRLNVRNALDFCRAAAPTFTMRVTPGTLSTHWTEPAVFEVDLRSWFGFSGNVSLSLSGTLAGSFDPAVVSGGSGTSTLTIALQPEDRGDHVLTVTASSGGIVRTAGVELEVTGYPPPTPIACGSTVFGTLSSDDPGSEFRSSSYQDRFVFEVTSEGLVTLFLDSEAYRTYLSLLDASGTRIDFDHLPHTGNYTYIDRELSPGTYQAEVASYPFDATGDYWLSLTCPGHSPGGDEVVIDFGDPYGIWAWEDDTRWVQIHHLSPGRPMVTADIAARPADDLIVDFGPPYGIWTRLDNGDWVLAHGASTESMLKVEEPSGDWLYADFGWPHGVWYWKLDFGSWRRLTSASPHALALGDTWNHGYDDDVVADFGTSGVWVWYSGNGGSGPYDGAQQLHTAPPEQIVTGDLDGDGMDQVIVDFGDPFGIWTRENGEDWMQLHIISPQFMLPADVDMNGQDDLVVDFGPPYGIYIWKNDAAWVQLHQTSQTQMVAGDVDGNGQDDLVIDFGPPYGIYIWKNDAAWVQLHHMSPLSMATGNLNGF